MKQNINRATLKANARARVQDRSNGIMQTTMRYLLVTSWVSTIFGTFVKNPLSNVTAAFYEVAEKIADEAIAANITTPDLTPAYAAASTVIRAILISPGKQAILFLFLLLALYTEVVRFGYRSYCLRTHQGETPEWTCIFDDFWMAGKILLLYVVTIALVFSGLFFFILPGLYIYYGLRFAPYVLMEHPDRGVFNCMMDSWKLTYGHKMQLFTLDLSFIFWEIGISLVSELGYRMGAGLHPIGGVIFSLALTSSVLSYYLPYKELSFIEVYRTVVSE